MKILVGDGGPPARVVAGRRGTFVGRRVSSVERNRLPEIVASDSVAG